MDPQHTPSDSGRRVGSTRPSAFSHLLYDRGVRFAAGLAIVVAIPVAVLFYFQFKSLNDLEAASAVVLRQLSHDSAESLTREIEEALKRPHIDLLLRPGQQNRLDPPDFAWIDTVFAEGLTASPFIEELWVWLESAQEHSDKFYVFDRTSLGLPGATANEPANKRFRESTARRKQLVPMLQTMSKQQRAIVAFPAVIDGRAKYVQVQLRFTPNRDRVLGFLGFMVDAEHLRTVVFPSLIEQRLANVQQSIGFPPLELYMLDAEGRPVTAPGAPPTSSVFVDERTPRRTSSDARPGECAPGTAVRRFRRSSARARGRRWR